MKPENMKSVTRSATSPDQLGDLKLQSDGMDNASRIQTKTTKYSGNQHGGKPGGNYGRPAAAGTGLTVPVTEGPKKPVTSSTPNFKAAMGPNDKLNFGKQERTPGGTRPFDPKAGQNYSGNPDQINFGRGPTVGNKQ